MAWIIGLGIFGFLFFRFPAFRVLTIIAGLGFALFVLWAMHSSHEKEQAAKSLIGFDQVEIRDLQLNNGHLSGEVKNGSNHHLTDLTIGIKAYDCPTPNINANCSVIGENNGVFFYLIDVPPGQRRALDTHVYFDSIAPPKGNFLWTYSIVGTRGK
jgi:hypothetical protein